MGKKDKAKKKVEEPTVVLQEELSGTLDKFCGSTFKPRFFRLTHGERSYFLVFVPTIREIRDFYREK
eukprot:SAG31_NODE_6097_length_2171_cov_39.703524_4_plen_67_part_00